MADNWIEDSTEFTSSPRYLLRSQERGAEPLPPLVALHGQGLSAQRFKKILAHLPTSRPILIPEAPYPFEIRSSDRLDVGYSWYMYTGDQDDFRAELERSEAYLLGLLDTVSDKHGIDSTGATLLGFSQGGYLAGFMGLRQPQRFAQLVLASTRLKTEFLSEELDRGVLPRLLVVHSEADEATPWKRSLEHVERFREAGGKAHVILHDRGHRLPRRVLAEVGEWMKG